MRSEIDIPALLRADPMRWHLLGLVAALGLPDAWIAAGFVRNAVWDALHNRKPKPLDTDVDVIWFDSECMDHRRDLEIEDQLRARAPDFVWSVKNQARMHLRNGDLAYRSATDAMCHWPETATAIAARYVSDACCDIAAPLGTDDLLNLIVRPTRRFIEERRGIFDKRVQDKQWLARWPKLRLA